MSKRLEFLEVLAASGKADSFALYGLAMEYRKEGRAAEAISVFDRLRGTDAGYLPMYLMAGQLLSEEGRTADAREWIESGIELATQKGDSKTKHELLALLDDC